MNCVFINGKQQNLQLILNRSITHENMFIRLNIAIN